MGPWRFFLVVLGALSLVGASFLGVAGAMSAGASPGHGSTTNAVSGHSCHGVFSGSPPGTLVQTTSAGASGNTVTPGQRVTVTLTWNPGDFGGNPPSKTVACVEVGSQISSVLSQEHKPGPSGGTDTFTFTAPVDTGGQPICVRTAVSGPITSTEKSSILCYTVLAAATPEVPNVLLLPIAGLLVAGGGVLLSRRRRATKASN